MQRQFQSSTPIPICHAELVSASFGGLEFVLTVFKIPKQVRDDNKGDDFIQWFWDDGWVFGMAVEGWHDGEAVTPESVEKTDVKKDGKKLRIYYIPLKALKGAHGNYE